MEVKTLKDIDCIIISSAYENVPSRIIEAYNKRLREEAINQIKELRRMRDSNLSSIQFTFSQFRHDEHVVENYLMWFYDITEDELKC